MELWVNSATGSDSNDGSNAAPMKTMKAILSKVDPGTATIIHARGLFQEVVNIANVIYKDLTIDGGEDCTFFGFDDDYATFDPAKDRQLQWKYAALSVKDIRNVTVKNMDVFGNTVIESVYKEPDKWLKNVTFENINFKYGSGRTIFSGAYTYEDLTIDKCTVSETCLNLSACTHGIYLSGGHWENSIGLPPVSGIVIRDTVVEFSGGRHGIQFNGRFNDVEVTGCDLRWNMFAGLSLIGVQDADIHDNLIFGNNRQGIVSYEYFDWAYYSGKPEIWRQCHQPNQRIDMHHNTIFVGPTRSFWYSGKSVGPDNMAAILINSKGGTAFPEFTDWEVGPFYIHDNIMVSPWSTILQFEHLEEFMKTTVNGNVVYSYNPGSEPMILVPKGKGAYSFDEAEQLNLYNDNNVKNPQFSGYPSWDYQDITTVPFDIDKVNADYNFFSPVGASKDKGKHYDAVWTKNGWKEVVKVSGEEEEVDDWEPPKEDKP